jgi:hypothetical protein
LALKENCEAQFCRNCKGKCEKPGYQGATRGTNVRETPQDVARRKEDHGRHDGHFRKLGPALTYARNENRNAEHAEDEASAEHNCEVRESGANRLEHWYRL